MEIKVLLFGQLAEIAGTAGIEMDMVPDTGTLQTLLENRFPGFKEMKYGIAVNGELIRENTVLTAGAAIALMPPFSRG